MKSKFLKPNILILIIISALILSSCLKDEDSEKRAEEKRLIEEYVNIHYPGEQPTSSGLYIITDTLRDPNGASPVLEDNDYMIFNYTGKYLESGSIFDSSDSLTAVNAKIGSSTFMEYNGPLKTSFYNSQSYFNFYSLGVIEGLVKMKEGGKYTLIMPSLLNFNNYKPVIFQVELLKVIDNSEIKEFELEQIASYISNWPKSSEDPTPQTLNDSTNAQRDTTISGLFFKIDSLGSGTIRADSGNTVTVNYTLKLLPYKDDKYLNVPARIIEKKDNFKTVLSPKIVIEGFYGAIKKMKKGEIKTCVIPYWRAYGVERITNSKTGRVALPECATLVYQIKLVEVTK
jgi:FKBP-type peptidyl-prolyl cis-trans isomerase